MKPITNITAIHLSKMLDELEGHFDNDPSDMSYEILEDYIAAAKHMEKEFGRKAYRVKEVQDYLDMLTDLNLK